MRARAAIRVVHTANRGPAAARNLGVAESASGFVAFLDADDIWKPERVARCIELLDHDPDVTWATTDLFVMDGDTITEKRWYDRTAKTAFGGAQVEAIAPRTSSPMVA